MKYVQSQQRSKLSEYSKNSELWIPSVRLPTKFDNELAEAATRGVL